MPVRIGVRLCALFICPVNSDAQIFGTGFSVACFLSFERG